SMRSKSPKSSRPTKRKAKVPSRTPKKTAKGKATEDRFNRSFADAVLKRARSIVAEYQIIVMNEDGEWYGRGLELPHVFGEGKTRWREMRNGTANAHGRGQALRATAAGGVRAPGDARQGGRIAAASLARC